MLRNRSIFVLLVLLVFLFAACSGGDVSSPLPDESLSPDGTMTHSAFKSGGITGFSGMNGPTCAVCHGSPNDAAPSLVLTGPTSLDTGATGAYTLTLTPASPSDQQRGGLDVAVDGGTLVSIAGQGTTLKNGEITHPQPKTGTGALSWDFQWTAPSASGNYHIYAAALSANGANGTGGDEVGTVPGFQVTVATAPVDTNLVADAGMDQTLVDADGDGFETVTLDGSGSTSPSGTITAWEWFEAGSLLGSGETLTLSLAVGTHVIELVVTNDVGVTASDSVTIVIEPALSGGMALYDQFCSSCHGDPGTMDLPPVAPQKLRGVRTCSIEASIYGNAAFPGGVDQMQFLQDQLSASDIDSISTYLNTFDPTGEDRYRVSCGGCHGPDGSGGRWEGIRGESASEISHAIAKKDEMSYLACLPSSDITEIAAYLGSGQGHDGDDDDEGDDHHGDGDDHDGGGDDHHGDGDHHGGGDDHHGGGDDHHGGGDDDHHGGGDEHHGGGKDHHHRGGDGHDR